MSKLRRAAFSLSIAFATYTHAQEPSKALAVQVASIVSADASILHGDGKQAVVYWRGGADTHLSLGDPIRVIGELNNDSMRMDEVWISARSIERLRASTE